jgi:ppGpp synthetase/RelA/SpoT-type nucleotidyltranferase
VKVVDTQHTAEEARLVAELVERYRNNISLIRGFLNSFHSHFAERIGENGPLSEVVHSVKYRMKDPEHLRSKLWRKIDLAKRTEKPFDINTENLFLKINDLGGYRILHLHTSQAAKIHPVLLDVIETAQFDLFEKPFANIWDEEAKAFFEGIGIRTEVNPRLYSSVHYVIQARSKHAVTCEIQSRTLADEIWGEVDHRINYPQAHQSRGCREQIKVLARVASSCSRLVDSIVVADDEWASLQRSRAADEPHANLGLSETTDSG